MGLHRNLESHFWPRLARRLINETGRAAPYETGLLNGSEPMFVPVGKPWIPQTGDSTAD
jgi:hypothetical protein